VTGLVRSEFHEAMFGEQIARAFLTVKDTFDPQGLFNPGKIVRAPRMDDRSLFRFKPGYAAQSLDTALDWSAWGGFAHAVEMCNNNGACRKAQGLMCPSYRATRDEAHLTRGRANVLRMALSGQLGPDALASDAMREAMSLCISCKGCKRECPTGVDMARMKSEFLYHYNKRHGVRLRERLVAALPRHAPRAATFGAIFNLRDRLPGLAALSELTLGLAARRRLPVWHRNPYRAAPPSPRPGPRAVVLFTDTFNTWFEPGNARAARRVLEAGGYEVIDAQAAGDRRPLCCGRTYLAAGLLDEARAEARRTLEALAPHLRDARPVIGLEPACLLTMRDEFTALLPGANTASLAAHTRGLEEFLCEEADAGRLELALAPLPATRALVHGHCHQKAFGVVDAITRALALIPGLDTEVIAAGCCGMAGAFGYEAEHYDLSMRIAEMALAPAVRAAPPDALLVACGTSCRQQIRHTTGREAVHVARVLDAAIGFSRGRFSRGQIP